MAPSNEIKFKDLAQNDIVVALMGPTGAGKSTIIDKLTNNSKKRAGAALASCTQEVTAIRIRGHATYGDRLVLVDTPGFDDTNKSDMEILQMIGNWLQATYEKHVPLAGILYLHRIKNNRMSGTPHRNLRMFGKLSGENAAKKVLLVTTYWDEVPKAVAEDRENQLKTTFWNPMIHRGAIVGRFYNTSDSAWKLVGQVLKETEEETLLLQEELVMLGQKLNETSAGKELYSTLQRLLSEQKQTVALLAEQARDNQDPALAEQLDKQLDQIQKDLEKTFEQLDGMKISFFRKFMLLFARKAKGRAIETC